MLDSLIDYAKFENKLRRIIQLNKSGATIYVDNTIEMLNFGCSKSEFILALKKDIDKTANDLIESLGIIKSISNGIITELECLDNSVEDFFGTTFDSAKNCITLSGVQFYICSNNPFPEKKQIISSIYENILNITKKELTNLSNSITLYEKSDDDLNKAILYPSLGKADELIEKVGYIGEYFNTFTKSLSFEEKHQFDITFKRSGVSDVIQNSTYVDKTGIRQSVHPKQTITVNKISELLVNNKLKYIEAVEIDGNGSCAKALRMIHQIERLKINCNIKFTLKIRKLGNHKVRGMFFPSSIVVAEDIKTTSALLHEIAHFVHLTNPKIFNNKFVNFMIDKLARLFNIQNLKCEESERIRITDKYDYYTDPREILARGVEIASLFAFEQSRFIQGSDEFNLIKSRDYYTELEGIYFDFTSFDEETKNEMLELYRLFYETSIDEVFHSNIDNYNKINTSYVKVKKEKSVYEIIKEERLRAEKEKKSLFSMVNLENISCILDNRGKISIKEISTLILQNLNYSGGHKKSNTIEDWSLLCIERSKIALHLLDAVKNDIGLASYIGYLYELQDSKVFSRVRDFALADGFTTNNRIKIKKAMKDKSGYESYVELRELSSLIHKTPLLLATKDIFERKAFVYNLIDLHPSLISSINESESLSNELFVDYVLYYLENLPKGDYRISKKVMLSDVRILKKIIELKENYNELSHYEESLFKLETFVNIVYNRFPSNANELFIRVSKELKNNFEFMSKYILLNEDLREFIGADIQHLFLESEEKINEVVIEENIDEDLFANYIKTAKIEEFKHTTTGEILKVLKIEEKIEDFSSFNKYLIKSGIAYYSRIAQGFVIKNLEKITTLTITALYSQDMLNTFSSGRLF